MNTPNKSSLSLAFLASLLVSIAGQSAHAQLADAAANYQDGTVGNVMTPVADTHGTGTWTYDLAQVNSDVAPIAYSGVQALTYENNAVGGSTPYYGTTSSPPYSYSVINLPAVSNGVIFPDSPAPATDFLEVHPGGGTAAGLVQWTAGAGETGTLSLTFDLSRQNVNPPSSQGAPGSSAGYDDFTVYRDSTLLYSDYDIYAGSTTGYVTLLLPGVTTGETLDFVTSASGGVLGNNLGYLSADISAVPEPATFALFGMGLLGCVAIGRFRKLIA